MEENGGLVEWICWLRVVGSSYRSCNVLGGANLSQLEVAGVLADGQTQHLGGFGFSLGLDNLLLAFLFGALDQEERTLRFLLGDLFALHSGRVLLAEAQLRQRHVVQDDVEVLCALDELATDQQRDLRALGNQLRRVELGHHALQHLVTDRGQHLLVVVEAQLAVHRGQAVRVRAGQHTKRDVHHLQILRAGRRGNLARPRPDVVDDRVLEPGHAEVQPLAVRVVADAADAVKDDRAVTTVDCENKYN